MVKRIHELIERYKETVSIYVAIIIGVLSIMSSVWVAKMSASISESANDISKRQLKISKIQYSPHFRIDEIHDRKFINYSISNDGYDIKGVTPDPRPMLIIRYRIGKTERIDSIEIVNGTNGWLGPTEHSSDFRGHICTVLTDGSDGDYYKLVSKIQGYLFGDILIHSISIREVITLNYVDIFGDPGSINFIFDPDVGIVELGFFPNDEAILMNPIKQKVPFDLSIVTPSDIALLLKRRH